MKVIVEEMEKKFTVDKAVSERVLQDVVLE